jgi:hypothetical protein
MIISREGLYGLVTTAGALAVLFAALCGSIRWLREWRRVEPPKEKRNRSH